MFTHINYDMPDFFQAKSSHQFVIMINDLCLSIKIDLDIKSEG